MERVAATSLVPMLVFLPARGVRNHHADFLNVSPRVRDRCHGHTDIAQMLRHYWTGKHLGKRFVATVTVRVETRVELGRVSTRERIRI